jgi:hypothetical protein
MDEEAGDEMGLYADLPLTSQYGSNKMERIANKLGPVCSYFEILQLDHPNFSEEDRAKMLAETLPMAIHHLGEVLKILDTIKR